MTTGEVIATVHAPLWRRVIGTGVLAVVGVAPIWFGFTAPVSLGVKVVAVAFGVGALVLAERLWQATAQRVELTRAGLRESGGRQLCRFDQIESVNRSAFAMKPSNGLLVRLTDPAPRGWAPGLWWRFGRNLGIGGVTPAGEAKVMNDAITLLIAEREGRIDLSGD